ncbi:hypothetical protein ACSV4D_07980 [Flavobacterium sp. ARAG 55.4]|uniref:hypothetical protein n=1 Tax=Flavobacterium sp. ARAG 55.4 TaxID=3451357 RepID=UPI003F47E830
MNNKYLLEKYDSLISEIQNPQKISPEYLSQLLNNEAPQSQIIYEVSLANKKQQVKISEGINSLHPLAPVFKNSQTQLSEEVLQWIPKIQEQLQIKEGNYNCFWDKERAVLYVIVNSKFENLSYENLFLCYCNWVLKKELVRNKIRIKETISSLTSRDKIQYYIQKKQINTQCLLSKLASKIKPETICDLYKICYNNIELDCLKLTYQSVEKLIRYLEIEHYQYLDKNGKAPYKTILETGKKIAPQYKQICSYCNQSQPDAKIVNIINDNLSKIIEPQLSYTVTYEELNYTIEFTTKLLQLINSKEDANFLITHLLLLNFNSFDFFDYYTDIIIKDLEKQPSEIGQIKLLYKYLKSTNQKQLHIQSKLIHNLPSTKEQIVAWIEEEIHYLNQKRLLEPYQPVKRENQEVNDKIQTGLSVPQLSYFFGLLIQTGIIQPKTQRAVFRFIANNFRTKITETISVDSINSKYYNVETATKMAVREKIIELLNLSKL